MDWMVKDNYWIYLGLVGVVLLGTWFVVWFLGRRFGFPRGSKGQRLQVRAARSIDPRRRLVILGCDEREYLVLLSQSGDILLDCLSTDMPFEQGKGPDGNMERVIELLKGRQTREVRSDI